MDKLIAFATILSILLICITNICFYVKFDTFTDARATFIYAFLAAQALFVWFIFSDWLLISLLWFLLVSDLFIYAWVQRAKSRFEGDIGEIERKHLLEV